MHIIELLRIRCHPGRRADFLDRDAAVWTPALARHRGFLGKEVWPSREDPDQVLLVVRWASMESFQSFPMDRCAELSAMMDDVQADIRCEVYETAD
ncbi:MAG: TIGR03792 family protein [Caldilineales bacterium]|nr:TIGR03792 family protein [Caldilineales bacterium]MCW5858294.1 TIGR03792 family protein [Caldilineales bacterium]